MKKNNLWKLAGALALTAVLAGCSSSISQEEATTIALSTPGWPRRTRCPCPSSRSTRTAGTSSR